MDDVRIRAIFKRAGPVNVRMALDPRTGQPAPANEFRARYMNPLIPAESYIALRDALVNVRTLDGLCDFFNRAGYLLVINAKGRKYRARWRKQDLTRTLVHYWRELRNGFRQLMTTPNHLWNLTPIEPSMRVPAGRWKWLGEQHPMFYNFGEFHAAARTVDGEEVTFIWADDPAQMIYYTIQAEKPTSHRCEYRRCHKIFQVTRRYSYQKKYCCAAHKQKEIKIRQRKKQFDTAMGWALKAEAHYQALSPRKKKERRRSDYIAQEAEKLAQPYDSSFGFSSNWVTINLPEGNRHGQRQWRR